jgi:Protein of unknown function (DUF2950)
VNSRRLLGVVAKIVIGWAALAFVSCNVFSRGSRTFATPEDAVRALIEAAKATKVEELVAIFGPAGRELIDSADPASTRRNLKVFTVAVAEQWQLVDHGNNGKMLIIGNEQWPFPVPLSSDGHAWRFDTAAGKEEVLARRIGRNELAAIRVSQTYVAAQRLYAEKGHDGQRSGLYARSFRSDPGRQNGLYWPAGPHHKRSPLGDLVARAAEAGKPIGQDGEAPSPFHGYYFRILTSQGEAAPGGAKDYVVGGEMSGGFALVAWPAQYDVTGVMTFIVNHSGVVHEKDLGPGTDAALASARYNPDASWRRVQ